MDFRLDIFNQGGVKHVFGYIYYGRLIGIKSLGGAISNFCHIRRDFERPLSTYAHSLNVCDGDLIDEMSRPSNNDFLRYVLINEGVSENMCSCYEMAHDSDLITWDGLLFYGENVSLEKGRGVCC